MSLRWDKYIGIPYSVDSDGWTGTDCWGLVALVYKNEFGIDLETFHAWSRPTTTDHLVRMVEFRDDLVSAWIPVETPSVGDILDITVMRFPHVGIVVDAARMLHMSIGRSAVIERTEAPQWRHRIKGFYRHEDRTNP